MIKIKQYENLYTRLDSFSPKRGNEVILECRNDDFCTVTILSGWRELETIHFYNPLAAQMYFNNLLGV